MTDHGKTFVKDGKVRSAILEIDGKEVLCVVSEGFMNTTGKDLQKIIKRFDPSRVLVVHDEVTVKRGKIKVSFNRGPAGHNGVKSIIDVLGSSAFFRFRVGIGRAKNIEKHVMREIGFFERHFYSKVYKKKGFPGLQTFFSEGYESAVKMLNKS